VSSPWTRRRSRRRCESRRVERTMRMCSGRRCTTSSSSAIASADSSSSVRRAIQDFGERLVRNQLARHRGAGRPLDHASRVSDDRVSAPHRILAIRSAGRLFGTGQGHALETLTVPPCTADRRLLRESTTVTDDQPMASLRGRLGGDRMAVRLASGPQRGTRDGAREVVQDPGRQVPARRWLGLKGVRADRQPRQYPAR
jgi:hypothetical protein